MGESRQTSSKGKANANAMLAVVLGGVFVGMIGMTYAAVPLYQLFCQVTGYGGTTRTSTQTHASTVLNKTITIRFDANTSDGLPWKFEPVQRAITVRIGASAHVKYEATNLADHATTGRATFNVTPQRAGSYFNKVHCFCFTNQTLAAGETKEMDIDFYIDPDIAKAPELKHVETITLSYTMFPGEAPKPVASAEGMPAKPAGEL
jgi:cytochrome c oxidase assembly protein subunit 11